MYLRCINFMAHFTLHVVECADFNFVHTSFIVVASLVCAHWKVPIMTTNIQFNTKVMFLVVSLVSVC